MALSPGSRVGTYEILAPIGRGGMGEVYRARDPKLQRDVAIKALPQEFERDRERLARFEREARLLASLNHTNIAAIYGLEEQGGARFLVMELIDGETIAERLAAGPLPLEDALSIAVQIACGLEAAHEAGIIHRDLKPSNVMVRPGGSVKVLDLGLARTVEPSGASDSSLSPTMTTPATHSGTILGTAAYMSPEQARGKKLDKRTDIFSFGCVLYECLTGRQPFSGESITDTLSAILRAEPDWQALPPGTPGRVRDLLRRCLQKDPKRRLHDIADARIEIEEALAAGFSGEAPDVPAAAFAPRRPLVWGIGGALVGAALIASISLLTRRPPQPALVSVQSVLPLGPGDRLWTERPSVAISPDGRTVVFAAIHDGVQRLFRRPLGAGHAEPISGAEQASRPFFSPDGQWVGFVSRARAALLKVPLSGGTAVSVCFAPPSTSGASWGLDGRIVFTPGLNRGLVTVPDSGGDPKPLTQVDPARGEHAHLYPQWLPGGRGILFTLRLGRDFTDVDRSNIAVLDTATGKWRTVIEGASFASYGGGRVLFVRGASVFSAPFDPARLEVTGPALPVTEDIAVDPAEGVAHFALSPDGTLAFVNGPAIKSHTTGVLRLDRKGGESVLPIPAASYSHPRLSPDGKRLAFIRSEGLKGTIAIYDRERGNLSTLTPETGRFLSPVWSPDGNRIAFSRVEAADPTLGVKMADGSGEIESLTPEASGHAEIPTTWSPDGRTIGYTVIYLTNQSATRKALTTDIWLLTLGGKETPHPWLETPFREYSAAFSPDGKWLAYVSDESGVFEVYVRPYPGPGAKTKISAESGIEPVWARAGQEIIYRTGLRAEQFMSVEIQTSPRFAASPPHPLFSSELAVGARNDWGEYSVSADGNEIIGMRADKIEGPDRQIALVTNFSAN
jgi:Tol biopolymer transport system component/tRNA A-37 threonylcarbamoyl transferase component Bud32